MTVAMNERQKIISEWAEKSEKIRKDTLWANGPVMIKVYKTWESIRLGVVIGDNPLEFLVNSNGVIGSRPVVVDFVDSKYTPCPEEGHILRSRSETTEALERMERVDAASYVSLDDDVRYLLFE